MYHENFLLMENKHRKLFAIKQPKRCKFMPKMHQNTFGGRAPPGPAEGAYMLPRLTSCNGCLLLCGRKGRGEKRGPISKGQGERRKREGVKKEGDEWK